MKRQIITDDLYHSGEDFSAAGQHMVEAVGNIAGDVAGYPHHYAGVTVSQQTATTVRINPGRLYIGDKVYDLDTPFDVNLQDRLPLVVNDTVWIALLLRGEVKTITAQRQALVDADNEETDVEQVPIAEHYTISGMVQAGIAGPTPLKPTVAETECIVAWVLLANTGVASIEMHPDHRVFSLYEVERRLTIIEFRVDELEQAAATLRTDLSAVAAAQRTAVRPDVFAQTLLDVSALKQMLRVFENEPRAYLYDPALVTDHWDTQHSLWLARVKEGVRFSFEAYNDVQLNLLNPANPDIRIVQGLMMPRYEEVVKLSVEGGTGSKNMSQLVHTEVQATQRQIARSSVSYGPIVTVCENAKDWGKVGDAARTKSTLAVNGENFQVVGLATNKQSADWNANPASVGHKNYDVQTVSVSSWTETYWDYVTVEVGLNGSVYGQTWLNSQMTTMTALRVRFTRVGSTGDVHAVICECGDDGAPDFEKVLEKTTVPVSQLAVGKVRFGFRPMLLEPGKRYAWFLVTTGNHQIAFVEGNKFAQGSMFQVTDGVWAQGSVSEDFEFDILGAKFVSTRTVIEFNPLTLAGGMSYVRLIAAGWAPDGTASVWEFQLQGEEEWRMVNPTNAQALYGLPALIRLRLVMVGTTDVAPAMVLDNKARGETGRTRNAISAPMVAVQFGLSTTQVVVDVMFDQWVAGEHTATIKLISLGVTYTATATSIWQDPDKPKRRRVSATFNGLPATTAARPLIEGTKAGVDEFFVENIFIMAK